jgi:exopolyphosphatase / guanosine-5'-triphosphate,3'-diphosphate pyrophosphatase
VNVAVVDIGSNSTRLLVAELSQDRRRVDAELERESNVTRLGQGVDASGRLAEEAMERVYGVLERYAEAIARHDAQSRVAVLTSAVRDAANGEEFASVVRERFGLEPHVLKGEDEARLTFLGATSERDADTAPTLVVDIGGGSTELVIGVGHEMRFHVSTQAGVVRQSERHIEADPPKPEELAALRRDVRATLSEAVPETERRAVTRGIAVAGTATSLAAIAQRLDPYDPARVHGYRLDAATSDRIRDELAAMPLAQRREVPGLHPDRAPTIIPGVLILECVMELFGLDSVEISEHDILRGAALGLAAMSVTVERVGTETLSEMLPLMRAYCDFYDSHPTDEALRAISQALIADPDREGIQFLARDESSGDAVAFATLYWSWETNRGGRVGVMNDLFVLESVRGGGIGRALIEACAGACRARGALELTWQTALDNTRAQALYDSVGARRSQWLDYSLELSSPRAGAA